MSAAYLQRTARFLPVSIVSEDRTTVAAADCPDALLTYWSEVIATQPGFDPEKEHLVVISLNTRLRPVAWNLVSVGSLNETIAHPREILRPAVVANAYAFVVMHNHPSGDPSPSRADRELTRRINEGAALLQIRLLDHLIVPNPAHLDLTTTASYFSFQEAGLL